MFIDLFGFLMYKIFKIREPLLNSLLKNHQIHRRQSLRMNLISLSYLNPIGNIIMQEHARNVTETNVAFYMDIFLMIKKYCKITCD